MILTDNETELKIIVKEIQGEVKNKTKREKAFATMKFSEKRAYTVIPETIVKGSSALKTNKVELSHIFQQDLKSYLKELIMLVKF